MRVLTAALSFIGLSLAATAAHAEWRGFATADVNMRDGPGTGYAVIDVVPEGARVFVDSCRGGWCDVTWRGEEGFLSRRYLEQTRVRDYAPADEIDPPLYEEPEYREVIVIDPPRYRHGRRIRDGRRFREGRRIRNRERGGRRIREGRRVREEVVVERPIRPRKPRADRGGRRNGGDTPRIGLRNRVADNNGCPVNIYCGGVIGSDPSNRK